MTTFRILTAVGLGFVLLMALIIGGSYLFVYFSVDEDFTKATKESRLEGANFGQTTDQSGCLTEGLKRSKTVNLFSGLKVQAQLEYFVESCLSASRPTKDFCQRVPADYELVRTENWKTEQCDKVNLSESASGCGYVFEQQINFCSRRAK